MDVHRTAMALRHCGRARAFSPGSAIHSYLRKLGVLNNVFLANNLISMYLDFSNLENAQKLFDEMLDKNVVTWTTMVSAYADGGRPYEALRLFDVMSKSVIPNRFTYSAVLKACSLVCDVELGRLIHERIFAQKLESDTILMNSLLDMYVKCGSLSHARKVFDDISCANTTSWNTIISGYTKASLMDEAVNLFNRMPQPNVVSWNTVIAGFAENGNPRALEFMSMMHREGLKLDGFTCPCALKTSAFCDLLAAGKQIHTYTVKLGLESNYFTVSALIDMYSNCNELTEAVKLFDENTSCNKSIYDSLALWNSMLSGYVINNQNCAGLKLISEIHRSGACLDSYTFSGALKVCINLLRLRLGLQVHGLVVTCGYELDYVVGSIIVDLYARLGNIDNSLELFHRLPKKDIIAWSGLIVGCAQMGLSWLAFSLFKDMLNLAIEIDHFVISTVLKVCSNLASLRCGKQVHAFCVKGGYETEEVTVTSLVDMYSKCGEIEDGLALFDRLTEKDTVSWTGIIVGCGQNGRTEEAIRFFNQMILSGSKPNKITFLGVLSACRHAGLVEEARTIFKSMEVEYKLEPYLEHYCCMVDLLGRAGFFEEAESLIAKMPFEPDQSTWRTLLAACGTHKNFELVNMIADHLLTTLPEENSAYVTLSNAYATLGKWHSMSKVRETAKKVGAKEAGMSWIEISS